METTKYSVGLDIGTTKIVAIIGKENEYGKIEVLGTGKSNKPSNQYSKQLKKQKRILV